MPRDQLRQALATLTPPSPQTVSWTVSQNDPFLLWDTFTRGFYHSNRKGDKDHSNSYLIGAKLMKSINGRLKGDKSSAPQLKKKILQADIHEWIWLFSCPHWMQWDGLLGLSLVNILTSGNLSTSFRGDCPGATLPFYRGAISYPNEPGWGERGFADLNTLTWNLLWV